MKGINTTTYTFDKLIGMHAIYVDKTKWIYQLISGFGNEYFCSRPRRFGKSLTLSALKAIFRGKRELFQNLFIGKQDYSWEEYPVIHLDFAREVIDNRRNLNISLCDSLRRIGNEYGCEIQGDTPALLFRNLIEALYEKYQKGVVLLIDEYDKPILDHLNNEKEAEEYRTFLDTFYQVIKGAEPMLRFVFITGVTRFAKVSIFSKLNNLTDITMSADYAEMFGYTEEELESYFSDYLEDGAKQTGVSKEEFIERIRDWYDGFLFEESAKRVYNPVSIGRFFTEHYKYQNFWFATGTASFLVKLLKKNHLILPDIKSATMDADTFDVFNVTELASAAVSNDKLIQMLYQTGYLTLDRLLFPDSRLYRLRFPNYEVERSFETHLLHVYAGGSRVSSVPGNLRVAALEGDTETIMEILESFFTGLPYDLQIKQEKYYQSIVYTIFKMCNMEVLTELNGTPIQSPTSIGGE